MAGNPPNSRRPPAPAWVGSNDLEASDFMGAAVMLVLTWVPVSFTATKMSFVVGVSSGNMQLGIYDAAGARLYQEASFAMPAAGGRSKTLTTPVSLPEGPLYLAMQNSDGGVAKMWMNPAQPPGVAFEFANVYANGLPATLPALTDGSNRLALIAYA